MPRKGENIYKRKDGRWEGRYIKSKSVSGKTQYGYVYARTYREVKNKLSYALSSKGKEDTTEKNIGAMVCFYDIAKEWFSMIQPQIKESTRVKYKNLLNSYILPELRDIPLGNITRECIEACCNELLLTGGCKGTGLSPKTVSDVLSLIRNILRYSAGKGNVTPCDAKSIVVKQNAKEMRILSRNEQEQLCQYLYLNLDAKNMGILICLFTGLRIGEICALKWEDISFSDRTIYVHQTMQRIQTDCYPERKTKVIVSTPKSSCSIRRIPISDDLTRIISDFGGRKNGYVLTGSEKKYVEPRTMQNHFKRVLQDSSLAPANYHALRHTFATRCVEVGFDVKSLSEILGHASVNITMNRYVHPSMELKRENMQRLSSLFAVK